MSERDPFGISAKTPGAKLDAGKPPLVQGCLQYFPLALNAVSEVSLAGAKKYSWRGWESVEDGVNRYSNALGRHLGAEKYEETDMDTGCLHAAQVAWNALARLELMLKEKALQKTKNPANDGWADCGKNVNSKDGEPRRPGAIVPVSSEYIKQLQRDTYDPYTIKSHLERFVESVPDSTGNSR